MAYGMAIDWRMWRCQRMPAQLAELPSRLHRLFDGFSKQTGCRRRIAKLFMSDQQLPFHFAFPAKAVADVDLHIQTHPFSLDEGKKLDFLDDPLKFARREERKFLAMRRNASGCRFLPESQGGQSGKHLLQGRRRQNVNGVLVICILTPAPNESIDKAIPINNASFWLIVPERSRSPSSGRFNT